LAQEQRNNIINKPVNFNPAPLQLGRFNPQTPHMGGLEYLKIPHLVIFNNSTHSITFLKVPHLSEAGEGDLRGKLAILFRNILRII
jgi:hypothetical protein